MMFYTDSAFVMPGLDPGIPLLQRKFFQERWIAGSIAIGERKRRRSSNG
jgi:hypothetical protein